MKILTIIAFTVMMALTASAGGPDIKPLPKIRPVQEVKPVVIEPLKETKKAKQAKIKTETITPAQPSYIPPEDKAAKEARMARVPPPVEKKVAVLFESIPANAELLLNGLYVGSAPIQLPIRNGVHNVRMILAGHVMWERQIKVYQGLRVLAILEKSREISPKVQ